MDTSLLVFLFSWGFAYLIGKDTNSAYAFYLGLSGTYLAFYISVKD